MHAVRVHGAGARRGRGHGGGGPLGNPISPGRGALRGFFLPIFFFFDDLSETIKGCRFVYVHNAYLLVFVAS